MQIEQRTQLLLRKLRQLERNPSSMHREGFLFKIDNVLAVLMYRLPQDNQARVCAARTAVVMSSPHSASAHYQF